MAGPWNIRYGRWWMVQWCADAPWFSLGLHVDWERPYVDVHLGRLIFSAGRVPHYTPELEQQLTHARGGVTCPTCRSNR